MMILKNINEVSSLTGKVQGIKNGDKITVKVLQKFSHSEYQISLRGKLFTVTSKLPLQPESTIKVSALWRGKQLLLQVIDEGNNSKAVLLHAGVPDTGLSQTIVKALQRSGLPLQAEHIAALYNRTNTLVSRSEVGGENDAFLARLLVILLDKGIDLPDHQLQTLVRYVTPDGGRDREKQNDKDNGRHKDDEEHDTETYSENGNLSPASAPENGKALTEKLKDTLKRYLIRGSGPSDPTLLLFNHMTAEHDNWIVIPFAVTIEEKPYEGTLRIKTVKNKQTILNYVVEVHTEKAVWTFVIDNQQKEKKTVNFSCSSSDLLDRAVKNKEHFSEKLRKLGVKTVDTIIENGGFDGFSPEMHQKIKKIDTVI